MSNHFKTIQSHVKIFRWLFNTHFHWVNNILNANIHVLIKIAPVLLSVNDSEVSCQSSMLWSGFMFGHSSIFVLYSRFNWIQPHKRWNKYRENCHFLLENGELTMNRIGSSVWHLYSKKIEVIVIVNQLNNIFEWLWTTFKHDLIMKRLNQPFCNTCIV